MRPGETPVPIPNTTVKTREADGTALETMWESRWAPDQEKNKRRACSYRNGHRQVSSVGNRTVKGEDWWPVLTRSAGKCCCNSWFYQWLEILNKKYLRFLMTDKISVRDKKCTLKTAYMKVWWKSNILDRKRLKRKIGRHRLKSVRADEDQQWESRRPHHLR